MGDLSYVGDAVNLSYAIETRVSVKFGERRAVSIGSDAELPLTKINVSVYNEEGEIVHEDPVKVVDNIVYYTLAPELTKHAGDYAAFFSMTFGADQDRTFKMPFAVLPIKIEDREETDSDKLTSASTEIQIQNAVGIDMRKLRRKGKKTQVAYDIAQEAIGKRIPK